MTPQQPRGLLPLCQIREITICNLFMDLSIMFHFIRLFEFVLRVVKS